MYLVFIQCLKKIKLSTNKRGARRGEYHVERDLFRLEKSKKGVVILIPIQPCSFFMFSVPASFTPHRHSDSPRTATVTPRRHEERNDERDRRNASAPYLP